MYRRISAFRSSSFEELGSERVWREGENEMSSEMLKNGVRVGRGGSFRSWGWASRRFFELKNTNKGKKNSEPLHHLWKGNQRMKDKTHSWRSPDREPSESNPDEKRGCCWSNPKSRSFSCTKMAWKHKSDKKIKKMENFKKKIRRKSKTSAKIISF